MTTEQYPCGCSATGEGDIPKYCPTHGTAPHYIMAGAQEGGHVLIDTRTGLRVTPPTENTDALKADMDRYNRGEDAPCSCVGPDVVLTDNDLAAYDHDELARVREVLAAAGFGDAQSFASPSKAVKALDAGYVEAQMRRVALIAAIDKAMNIDWNKESRDDMDAHRIARLTAFAASREDTRTTGDRNPTDG